MIATLVSMLVSWPTLQPRLLGADPRREDGPAPTDITIGDDAHKRYLLHGPGKDASAPANGWKVLLVMPGGSGSAEFSSFVGRIRVNALGQDWVIAQIVAPVWSEDQAKELVWPTKRSSWPKMEFTCEELVADVLADLATRMKLDRKFIFTLGWSSSGTLAYTLGLQEKTPITGTFVAMSVFKPDLLPNLKSAKSRSFYILHSPEDGIPIRMAEDARDSLTKKGANVQYATYAGGHGWHGDVYGMIRTGVDWLTREADDAKVRTTK